MPEAKVGEIPKLHAAARPGLKELVKADILLRS